MMRWRMRAFFAGRGLWPEAWSVNLQVAQKSQLRRRAPASIPDLLALVGDDADGIRIAPSIIFDAKSIMDDLLPSDSARRTESSIGEVTVLNTTVESPCARVV